MTTRSATAFLALIALLPASDAYADPLANVLVRALIEGNAVEPLPARPEYSQVMRMLQQQAGDDGPIAIRAARLVRFEQQPRCGRIVYALSQPSSRRVWSDLGGQLNMCEDGQPPLRQCAAKPGTLVPPDSKCADNSAPQDTPEVAKAIQNAIAHGSLTREQLVQRGLWTGQTGSVR